VEVRLRLLTGELSRHPASSPATLERVRRIAEDIARRAGISPGTARLEQAGRVLALGFPDRLAIRRGSPGRFQLRTGTTAWLPERDPLATEPFLVAVDTDGKRRDARIRLAAPLDPDEVASAFRHEVDETVELVWDGDCLLERRERRLGGMVLDRSERRPPAGPAVTAALAARLRREGIERLGWSEVARRLRERVRWLHRRDGERWPDWSEEALAASVEEWLFPEAGEVTGWDDLQRLDLERLLRRRLGPLVSELDRLAPSHLQLPSGRRVAVDYAGEVPAVAVRVQELFGVEETPQVGGVPVVLHLLSPAGRPVQITRDLAGFWKGSWHEVRKEMAGRYPKHAWPEDPTSG
jgi:ATP-dependent helicase HrpB